MSSATLKSKGQITIPKDIREEAQLESGDQLDFCVTPEGRIIIIPQNLSIRDVKGILKPYAKKKKKLSSSEVKKIAKKQAVKRMKS